MQKINRKNDNSTKMGKRKRKKKIFSFKDFLSKVKSIASYTLCLGLTFTITIISCFNLIKKNDKNNNMISYIESIFTDNDSNIEQINNNESEITKEENLETNILETEDKLQTTNDIYNIEYKDEIFQNNSDLVLEIAGLLDKYNMTYQELLDLVMSIPECNQALQNIIDSNPNISSEKLIAILQGKDTELRDTLYIGDSRTKGMLLSGVINENNSVYGVGYGYNWFVGEGDFSSSKTNALNGAINGIESKMSDEAFYNIVIWLGVNDYTYVDANTYFNKFEELALNNWSNHKIYIVSVGPVKDSSAVYVSNVGINNFNDSLKELVENSYLDNLYYIDLNLTENSINTYDAAGLHYGASDYQNIFYMVTKTITNAETNDINILLSIFYSVLDSYDKYFDDYIKEANLQNEKSYYLENFNKLK